MNKVVFSTLLLAAAAVTAANGASAADTTAANKPAGTTTLNGNVIKKATAKPPKYHIDVSTPTTHKHSSNTFTDISQSMPAAAVRENLARKHELPNAQTAILRPGASAGSPTGGGTKAPMTGDAAGSSPEVLSAGKVAVPESKGTTNTFFK